MMKISLITVCLLSVAISITVYGQENNLDAEKKYLEVIAELQKSMKNAPIGIIDYDKIKAAAKRLAPDLDVHAIPFLEEKAKSQCFVAVFTIAYMHKYPEAIAAYRRLMFADYRYGIPNVYLLTIEKLPINIARLVGEDFINKRIEDSNNNNRKILFRWDEILLGFMSAIGDQRTLEIFERAELKNSIPYALLQHKLRLTEQEAKEWERQALALWCEDAKPKRSRNIMIDYSRSADRLIDKNEKFNLDFLGLHLRYNNILASFVVGRSGMIKSLEDIKPFIAKDTRGEMLQFAVAGTDRPARASLPIIEAGLADEDSFIVAKVAECLSAYGDQQSLDALHEALKVERHGVYAEDATKAIHEAIIYLKQRYRIRND